MRYLLVATVLYHITLYIQPDKVSFFVIKQNDNEKTLVFNEQFIINLLVDNNDFACLEQQFLAIRQQFPLRGHKKNFCTIILSPNLVMQQLVKIPNITLLDYEKIAYLEVMLNKVFSTTDALYFDFVEQGGTAEQKYQTILLVAILTQPINSLSALLKKYKITPQFIGIPAKLLNSSISEHELLVEKLITEQCVYTQQRYKQFDGINFLPWRQQMTQHKKRCFSLMLVGYLSIFIIVLFSYSQFITNKNEKQQLAYTHLLNDNQFLINELLQKQVIDKEINALKRQEQQQKQQYEMQQHVLEQMQIIAQMMPDSTWLSALDIRHNEVVLTGYSIFYHDILQLVESLHHQDKLTQSKIQFIKKQDYLLQFQLILHYHQQNVAEQQDEF